MTLPYQDLTVQRVDWAHPEAILWGRPVAYSQIRWSAQAPDRLVSFVYPSAAVYPNAAAAPPFAHRAVHFPFEFPHGHVPLGRWLDNQLATLRNDQAAAYLRWSVRPPLLSGVRVYERGHPKSLPRYMPLLCPLHAPDDPPALAPHVTNGHTMAAFLWALVQHNPPGFQVQALVGRDTITLLDTLETRPHTTAAAPVFGTRRRALRIVPAADPEA